MYLTPRPVFHQLVHELHQEAEPLKSSLYSTSSEMLVGIRIASAVIKYRRLSQPLSLLSQQMCKRKEFALPVSTQIMLTLMMKLPLRASHLTTATGT